MPSAPEDHSTDDVDYDAIVVGAGFGGVAMIHELRKAGLRGRVFDGAPGVGGVWNWNRYPGARCDVEAYDYCYSFSEELQQEWEWSERYPTQPELERYLNPVVERFGLAEDIQLNTWVVSAIWDEDAAHWTVTTDDGVSMTARFCVMATGCLSAPQDPGIPGLESFEGDLLRTARWPAEAPDLAGKRIAVIGTGSSGVQVAPVLAQDAGHLYMFQRTPNHSVPSQNRPADREEEQAIKAAYAERREASRHTYFGIPLSANPQATRDVTDDERAAIYEDRWQRGGFNFLLSFGDMILDKEANALAAEFIRDKIRATVKDPHTAERLLPGDHPIGTKRICVDSGYYEMFNRDNVTLLDARDAPIEAVVPEGIRTPQGVVELDAIVLATGFDAFTGAMTRIDIRGRDGLTIKEAWADGPVTYLGLSIVGFPNLLSIAGPGSPSVLSNMVMSCEHHAEWIANTILYMREHEIATIEATEEAQTAWVTSVNELAASTLYREANSWYTGANVPGKAHVFMAYTGGVGTYLQLCEEVVAEGYRGFALGAAPAPVPS
jgi:cyclohexanone monooxygenase